MFSIPMLCWRTFLDFAMLAFLQIEAAVRRSFYPPSVLKCFWMTVVQDTMSVILPTTCEHSVVFITDRRGQSRVCQSYTSHMFVETSDSFLYRMMWQYDLNIIYDVLFVCRKVFTIKLRLFVYCIKHACRSVEFLCDGILFNLLLLVCNSWIKLCNSSTWGKPTQQRTPINDT